MHKLYLKKISALILAAGLAACAQPHIFTKAGANNQSFNADKLECTAIANSVAQQYSGFGNIYMIAAIAESNQRNRTDVFDTCMQARGYTLTIGRPVPVASSPQTVAPAAQSPLPPPVAPAPPSTPATSPTAPDVVSNPTAGHSNEYQNYEAAMRQYEQAQQLYQSELQGAAAGKPPQTMSVAAVLPPPSGLSTSHPSQPLDDDRRSLQNAEAIPLQRNGNTYSVPVRINDTITLPFFLDTGATDLAIPADVALTLARAGALRSGDFIGKSPYQMANGSEELGDRVVIREVRVGKHAVRNVTASITPPNGEPLLGQSFLSKFGAVTVDYKRLVLVLSP